MKKRRNLSKRARAATRYMPKDEEKKWHERLRTTAPVFEGARDETVRLAFNANAFGMDSEDIVHTTVDTLTGVLDKANFRWARADNFTVFLFRMDWGKYATDVIGDNRDTCIGSVRLPKGISSTYMAHHELWETAVRDPRGKHPKYGDVLLWILSTISPTHPLRQEFEKQVNMSDLALLPMSDVRHAIVLTLKALLAENKEYYQSLVFSNAGEISEDFTMEIDEYLITE